VVPETMVNTLANQNYNYKPSSKVFYGYYDKGTRIGKLLIKKTPDNFIKSVNDEISTILNRHFDDLYPEYDTTMNKLSMPLEITDKENEYGICAELPGIKKENLDIDLKDNYLTISAKKEEEHTEGDKTYKKSEFKYGEFSRTVYFPEEINVENYNEKLEHLSKCNRTFEHYSSMDSIKEKARLTNI